MNFKVSFTTDVPTLPLPISRTPRQVPIDLLKPSAAQQFDRQSVERLAHALTLKRAEDICVTAAPCGTILDGSLRWAAAKRMNCKTILVVVVAIATPPSIVF